MHNLFYTNAFNLLLIKNGAHENQLINIPPVDKMATYLGPYMGMRRSMEDYMGMGDYMGNGWTTIWWGRQLYGYGKSLWGGVVGLL